MKVPQCELLAFYLFVVVVRSNLLLIHLFVLFHFSFFVSNMRLKCAARRRQCYSDFYSILTTIVLQVLNLTCDLSAMQCPISFDSFRHWEAWWCVSVVQFHQYTLEKKKVALDSLDLLDHHPSIHLSLVSRSFLFSFLWDELEFVWGD